MSSTCQLENLSNPTSLSSVTSSVSYKDTATNSMVFVDLPLGVFEEDSLKSMRQIVESLGHIQSWVPLRSMRRIMVVFDDSATTFGASVKMAKEMLHNSELFGDFKLKVFSLKPVHASSSGNHLEVQKAKNLWLISPPASPPSDWEATEEDPPNSATFSSDLVSALKRLKLDNDGCVIEAEPGSADLQNDSNSPKDNVSTGPSIQLVLDGQQDSLPSIMIQDCGSVNDFNSPGKLQRPPAFPRATMSSNP